MSEEPKDLMILGAIKSGAKKFDKIQKITKLDPKEINDILEELENKGLIRVEEKKGWLGKKIEIKTTDKGNVELEHRIHELQQGWDQMVKLYKSGDKSKLKDYMDDNKSFLPTMMFFGIIDMMMFSMMFSMMGMAMSSYVPAESMPADMGSADSADAGGDDLGGMDDGGFDIDIGF